jgi:hypothetical protein
LDNLNLLHIFIGGSLSLGVQLGGTFLNYTLTFVIFIVITSLYYPGTQTLHYNCGVNNTISRVLAFIVNYYVCLISDALLFFFFLISLTYASLQWLSKHLKISPKTIKALFFFTFTFIFPFFLFSFSLFLAFSLSFLFFLFTFYFTYTSSTLFFY